MGPAIEELGPVTARGITERVLTHVLHPLKERTMQIDKQQIIELLKSRGDHDQAEQAATDLPDQVDTDQHADLLSKVGVNAQDLPGGLGELGGKLGF
jgi:hypothetical protein